MICKCDICYWCVIWDLTCVPHYQTLRGMGRGELLHLCQFSRPLKWAELPLYLGPEHDIRQVDHAFLRLCFLKFSLRFVQLTSSRFMVVTLCITSWPLSCIMHVNIKWIVHYLIPTLYFMQCFFLLKQPLVSFCFLKWFIHGYLVWISSSIL